MPEDGGRESLLQDGGEWLVKEPKIFPGSLNVVVDASELMIADPVSNLGLELSQPDFSVAELNSGGEAEAGNLLADAVINGATSEPFASVEEDSKDDEES